MNFSRSVIEIIRERTSKRSYTPAPIEEDRRQALLTALRSARGPFDVKTRFELVDTEGWADASINALGTYGTIQGARFFIVGLCGRGERDMEGFGYAFESIILRATDLGLGTCWIGGVFNRSGFAGKAGAREEEAVPAVSPVGHSTPRRSLTDSVIRWSAGARARKSRDQLFFSDGFGTALSDAAAGPFLEPTEMVRLGPSASNRQPWRIVKEKDTPLLHFYMRRSAGYGKLIRAVDLQRIDMGIAMCHFELTARELGLPGEWRISEPDLGPLPERTSYLVSWDGR